MNTSKALSLFLKSRQAKGLSRLTINWYRGILLKFVKEYPALPIQPEDIESFMCSCTAGDERRHGYFRALKVFFRFLKRRYDLDNPVDKVDPPKRRHKLPRPLTLDELDQLLNFPFQSRLHAAIVFLADTGARIGEAANLKPYDLARTGCYPVARITGKTGTRLVPISESTYALLTMVLPFNYSANRLSRLVAGAFRMAHVKGTAHTLRHTFATYWEGDELILKYILGHSHLATTETYRQLRTKRMSEQHCHYSPLKLIVANRQLILPLDTG